MKDKYFFSVASLLSEGLPDRDDVFERVFEQHSSKVRGILFRLVGANDLEDVQQEVFVRIWKGLNFFRRQSKLSTWIYRVTVNTAIDFLRAKKNRVQINEVFLSSEASSPEDVLYFKRCVTHILKHLDIDQQTVIALYVFEEFKIDEIAKILEIPSGTVKSRLSRARDACQKELEKIGVKL